MDEAGGGVEVAPPPPPPPVVVGQWFAVGCVVYLFNDKISVITFERRKVFKSTYPQPLVVFPDTVDVRRGTLVPSQAQ